MKQPQTKITQDIINQINNPEIELFFKFAESKEQWDANFVTIEQPVWNKPCYSLQQALENTQGVEHDAACYEIVYGKKYTVLYHKDVKKNTEWFNPDGIKQYFVDLRAIKAQNKLKKE